MLHTKFIFFSFAINFHSTRCNFLVRVNPDKLRGITHVRGKGYKHRITFVIDIINQQDLSRKCSVWKGVQNNSGSEKNLAQKMFWVRKKIGPTNFLGPKNCWSKKKFESKNNFGP